MPADPLQRIRKRLKISEDKIKSIKDELKPRPDRPPIKIGKQEVHLKKAFISPDYKSKTILTDSTWSYVEIYLKQERSETAKEALFYWEQAKHFYNASTHLPLVAAPLTIYYCFLNATKALLKFKKINFDLKHGVSGKRKDGHFLLQNELVMIKPKGVLSGLSNYLKEPIKNNEPVYSLKDILFNLSFIHRAFQITYNSPFYPDLFIPIVNPRFVFDKHRKVGWFEAKLEKEHSTKRVNGNLVGFGLDLKYDNRSEYTIRRNKTFKWDCRSNTPTQESLNSFSTYNLSIRKRLRTIYSPNNLWYIKRTSLSNIIDKSNLVLIYAAMHRLSEIARYEPQGLKKHLEKNHSWLLTEFISKAPLQFIDEISSEITGKDFRITGFRA
jgi:hypothetical protein